MAYASLVGYDGLGVIHWRGDDAGRPGLDRQWRVCRCRSTCRL